MKLWGFLRKEFDTPIIHVVIIASVAGLSNALLLVFINSAAHEGPNVRLFLFFTVAILLYIFTQKYILSISAVEVERVVERIRTRLADKIRKSDLLSLEHLGRSQVYASVNRETQTLSQATAPIIIACQGGIFLFFSLFYMFTLSRIAFVLTLIILGVAIFIHFGRHRELMAQLQRSMDRENYFFEILTHLLDGFKEVKLNEKRSTDLFDHLRKIAESVADSKTKTGAQFASYYIFTQTTFYLLIATMVFILPEWSEAYSERVTEITATILFIIGPVSGVVGAVPVFSNANLAIQNIEQLEETLDRVQREAEGREGGQRADLSNFRRITFDHVLFHYKDKEGHPLFTIGPIDLQIDRGEIIFIVGGNGCGKSTFLKLLTGLYYPVSGRISVDDAELEGLYHGSYRDLFSAIFADYHLFDRLYGLADVEKGRVQELLKLMGLENKTGLVDGRFENQELSTGQMKRLALIVSLLEDKPIYVFDEWAAEQDSSFREFFYNELLKDLKARGKTIIAASHDDRYFHVADRVLKMEYGQFVG